MSNARWLKIEKLIEWILLRNVVSKNALQSVAGRDTQLFLSWKATQSAFELRRYNSTDEQLKMLKFSTETGWKCDIQAKNYNTLLFYQAYS